MIDLLRRLMAPEPARLPEPDAELALATTRYTSGLTVLTGDDPDADAFARAVAREAEATDAAFALVFFSQALMSAKTLAAALRHHCPDLHHAGCSTAGEITPAGLRTNVSVGIRYIAAWLSGVGAAAIDNLMEDAATAEISRGQVWQWVRHGRVSREDVERTIAQVSAELPAEPVYGDARALFERLALADEFAEFLTLPAYERLLEVTDV